jgi:hypothetical protein
MALTDEIRALRDRTLRDLIAAHDYFAETRSAWDIVEETVVAGRKLTARNVVTGTVATEIDLVTRSRDYVAFQLAESTFQQFIATFESFFFDLLRLWLTAYPQNLFAKKIDFKTVFEAADKDAVTALVVGKELNEVLYERPKEWFAYLEERAKLGCPTPDEIDRLAEAKASRDVLAHNRGVATRTYEAKAGRLARHRDGERIDISERYHREVWELLCKLVADVANAAVAKLP